MTTWTSATSRRQCICHKLIEQVDVKELDRMTYWHALPDGWENMKYSDFLTQRRERMARVMADAYKRLSGPSEEERRGQEVSLVDLIGDGETSRVEFKATLRVNLHTGQKDPRMELAILKTVAGFLNTQGGDAADWGGRSRQSGRHRGRRLCQ